MKKLITIAPLCFLIACGSFWEYRSLKELKQFTWNKSNILTFESEISKDGRYDIYILFRHVQGFPYKDMAVNMQLQTADTSLAREFIIPVIDDNRQYLGEGSVDIWDIKHLAYEDFPLKKGKCEFALEHAMNREEIQLVMEVGVQVERSKDTSE